MSPERLAEIRALLDAATPGPWSDEVHYGYIGGANDTHVITIDDAANWPSLADVALIAAAPTIIAELLAWGDSMERGMLRLRHRAALDYEARRTEVLRYGVRSVPDKDETP